MFRRLPCLFFALFSVWFPALLATYPAGVAAQVPDPTRPADVSLVADSPAAGSVSGVQAIILRRGGRASAVIAGQEVRVGDRVGDPVNGKRVLKISENAVVVQGEGGRETLHLISAAEKTPAAKSRAAKHHVRRVTGTQNE